MAKFPNPFFRKYTYPNTNSLRISSLNKLLPHKIIFFLIMMMKIRQLMKIILVSKKKSPVEKIPR